ncbi:MAG: 3-oxoacid CoA-transferase subunit B [Proteobacteria bacterium]|nr:3-oxoacid CoA-transferase subunit B [Pseudomonadota bacterium]
MTAPLNRDQMAWRVAQDIPGGSYVNLGIGMPEMVSNHLPEDRQIIFHCENGILGMGPVAAMGEEDFDLVTAGKKPVTAIAGAAFFDSADSFAMIRGGHLDIAVLGAFQVSAGGDLANWSTGLAGSTPAVGGAMDLAQGARAVFVITEHTTKDGAPKIIPECSYPLTAAGVVTSVFTDLAVIDIGKNGPVVREMVAGLSFDDLQARTGATLTLSPTCKVLKAPALKATQRHPI